jgi:hypothetical protein
MPFGFDGQGQPWQTRAGQAKAGQGGETKEPYRALPRRGQPSES